MYLAGQAVGATLSVLQEAVRPGIKTRELDAIADRQIKKQGGKPAFKGYRGFPAHYMHVNKRRNCPRYTGRQGGTGRRLSEDGCGSGG